MKALLTRFVLLALAAQTFSACGMGTEFMPSREANQTLKVKVGETFILKLAEPVMPYVRQLKSDYDKQLVSYLKQDRIPPGGLFPAPGAVGDEAWQFKATKAGTTILHFEIKPSSSDEGTQVDREVTIEVTP